MGQNQLDPDQEKFQNETSVNAHCDFFLNGGERRKT